VQFEFMQQLASRCPENIGGFELNRGMNMGGTPWTHLRFAMFNSALPGGVWEVLFHRVDARKDEKGARRYYLCTRQYAVVKGRPEVRTEKLRRLRTYRELYYRAARGSGCGLTFSRPAGDNQGANESDVGVIFLDTEMNSVSAVLDRFPLLHRAFVESIKGGATTSPEGQH
jgi:hypothetical protein